MRTIKNTKLTSYLFSRIYLFFHISDGIVEGEGSIIEIKCPYGARDFDSLHDAVTQKKVGPKGASMLFLIFY